MRENELLIFWVNGIKKNFKFCSEIHECACNNTINIKFIRRT